MLNIVSVGENMIYKVNDILEIDYKCRGYCIIPYHGHPKGCPNFGNHEQCPPKAPLISNFFDLNENLFFVVEEFDLRSYFEQMKVKHPDWTDAQLRNLLYWQGGVRKKLKEKTEQLIRTTGSNMIYTLLPEAMGVMVINTALKLGIPIEKKPRDRIFKIALVGYSTNNIKENVSNRKSLFA